MSVRVRVKYTRRLLGTWVYARTYKIDINIDLSHTGQIIVSFFIKHYYYFYYYYLSIVPNLFRF